MAVEVPRILRFGFHWASPPPSIKWLGKCGEWWSASVKFKTEVALLLEHPEISQHSFGLRRCLSAPLGCGDILKARQLRAVTTQHEGPVTGLLENRAPQIPWKAHPPVLDKAMKLNESCPLQARHPQPPKHAVMPGTRRFVTLEFLGKGSALLHGLHGLHGPVASGPNRHRSEDDRGSAQRPWGCGKRGRNLFNTYLAIQKERHIAFCHHVLWIISG